MDFAGAFVPSPMIIGCLANSRLVGNPSLTALGKGCPSSGKRPAFVLRRLDLRFPPRCGGRNYTDWAVLLTLQTRRKVRDHGDGLADLLGNHIQQDFLAVGRDVEEARTVAQRG